MIVLYRDVLLLIKLGRRNGVEVEQLETTVLHYRLGIGSSLLPVFHIQVNA